MPDSCIKRRLLFASAQCYAPDRPVAGRSVGWTAPIANGTARPEIFTAPSPHGPGNIDCALVGRVPEGIVLAFRGTLPPFTGDDHPSAEVALDWLNNVELLSARNASYPGRVHAGFASSVDRLWPQIRPAIVRLIRSGERNRLFVTGHSKGGALANLAAWRALGIEGLDGPVRVLTIAGARAGNEDFRAAYQAHGGIECTRYESAFDVVPLLPFGRDTPGWARALASRVRSGLLDYNFVPVGTRVPLRTSLSETWQAARRYAGWLGLGGTRSAYMPLLATAHDISPGSGYDRLICDGEPGCAHN